MMEGRMNREWNSSKGKVTRRAKKQRAALSAAIALVFGLLGATTIRATPNPSQNRGVSAPATTPNKTYGWKSAPITMEVFSDYQCPYCRAFYDTTLRQVISTYVASEKVYLVHRDFPLVMHRYSGEAARWANACAEVGQFETAEAALYDNQDSWGEDGNIGKYVAAAMPASDFKRVEALMKNGAMPAPRATGASLDPMAGISRPCPVDPYISQDIKLGYQFHVTGTPTFIITYKGRQFSMAATGVSWPVLKQFFDTLLQQ
jgi:protein-disulfide isomerase